MACKSLRPVKCVTPFVDSSNHLAFRVERSAEEALVGRAVVASSPSPFFRPILEWLLPGCTQHQDSDAILGRLHVFDEAQKPPDIRNHLKGSIKPAGPESCGDFCGTIVFNITTLVENVQIPPNQPGAPNISASPTPTAGFFVCPVVPESPFPPDPCCCFVFEDLGCNCPCPLTVPFGNCFIGFVPYACIKPVLYCLADCTVFGLSPTTLTRRVSVGITRGSPSPGFVTIGCGVSTPVVIGVGDCGLGAGGGSGVVAAPWFAGIRTLTEAQFDVDFCGPGVVIQNRFFLDAFGFAVDPIAPLPRSAVGYGGTMTLQAGP